MQATANKKQQQAVVLPAHRKLRRGTIEDSTKSSPEGAVQQVYTPGYAALLEVPAAAVHHLPDPGLHVTRLVLCSNYDAAAADPAATCAMGARCKFVHADTRGARERGGVHVNYAWRTAEDVTYERFRPGKVLHVAPPNGKAATDVMDSQLALKTRALQAKRRPLSHCAHYYFNRACNLGAECQFVHAVFIDPAARKYQRAPMPSQLGRAHRDRAAPAVATPPEPNPTVRFPRRSSSFGADELSSPSAATAPSGRASLDRGSRSSTPPLLASGASSSEGLHTPSQYPHPPFDSDDVGGSSHPGDQSPARQRPTVHYYRHDPYATASPGTGACPL